MPTVTIEPPFEDEREAEYDAKYVRPTINWIEDRAGDEVTHRMQVEIGRLNSVVMLDYVNANELTDDEEYISVWHAIIDPVENAMLALWNQGRALEVPIAQALVAWLETGNSEHLDVVPRPAMSAFRNDTEFGGGPDAAHMIISNLGHAAAPAGRDPPYTDEEIEEAKKEDRGPDYDFDLEQWIDLEPYDDE